MAKHQWVEIKYTPIEVEADEDGKTLHIFATEGAMEAAEEDTVHGCWHCKEVLLVDNVDAECIALAAIDDHATTNRSSNGEQD